MQVIKLRLRKDPGNDDRAIVTFFLGTQEGALQNAGEIRVCAHEWTALYMTLKCGARVGHAKVLVETMVDGEVTLLNTAP